MKYRQTKPITPRPRSLRRRGQAYTVEKALYHRVEPSVSIVVMAHPKRASWAVELGRELDCEIVWDKYNDRHETGLRAIKAHDVNADYHCVVQDDVQLAPDFIAGLREALKYSEPDCPVGLYYGGKGNKNSLHSQAISAATKNGCAWLERKGPIWGPGIVYPVSTIGDLIHFFEESIIENYDRRVMRYYESVGKKCWYTVPSLVEHRQEDNRSLCNHDRPNRQASYFCGPQSALDVDWSGSVLKAAM